MQPPEKHYKRKIAEMQGKIDMLEGLSTELVELQYESNKYLRNIAEGTLKQIRDVSRVLGLIKKRLHI